MSLTPEGTVRVLQAFRESNPNYYAFLPEVTIDNVLEVGGRIANNRAMFTDFMHVIEKVATTYIQSPKFENPLSKHKRSVSEYGSLIEEIFIGLVEAKVFRGEDSAKDLFKKERPNIDSAYYRINREESYKVTVDEVEIKRGLREEGGLGRIVDQIIGSMSYSNENDEYKDMKALIEGAYKKGELYLVEVGDIVNDTNARTKFVKKARQYSVLARYENQFNAKGVRNTARREEMRLYTTAEATAEVDVDVLAKAFNINNTNFIGETVELDRFADDNLLAVYLDNSFFVVADNLREVTSQFDASALTTNWWLHIIQTIARSPFSTAIAFVKEIPEDMQARLVIDPTVAIIGPKTEFNTNPQLRVGTALQGFDGSSDDLSEFTVTATADTAGVDIEVDVNTVIITPNSNAEPGENFTVTFKATYGADEEGNGGKTVTTKGHYSISKSFRSE